MKTQFILAVAVLFACLPLQSCPSIGTKVDALALFEPAQLAWPEVKSDIEAGYVAGEASGELRAGAAVTMRAESERLETALKEKDRAGIRVVPWPAMYLWAVRGIDAQLDRGEIGPGVADTFREHDANFDLIMQRLRGIER